MLFNNGLYKHVICMGIYCLCLFGAFSVRYFFRSASVSPSDVSVVITVILTFVTSFDLTLNFIFAFTGMLGVVLIGLFPGPPRLKKKSSLQNHPRICFRVVTRGLYPQLVADNLDHNLSTCEKVGLKNYLYEVVTDSSINLPHRMKTKEIVVPTTYRTKHGTLNKGRALQYCLEPGVDNLVDSDWIVHLDEETQLTQSALIGIINFVSSGRHQFGSGSVTYANGKIVNWLTTMIDNYRVGADLGILRFTMKYLHFPFLMYVKGSFLVAKAAVEKNIAFDQGPASSITEDSFFIAKAMQRGYSFSFVEGVMMEKSPFTVKDFVQQRRRWIMGTHHLVFSSQLRFLYRVPSILMDMKAMIIPFRAVIIVMTSLCVTAPRLSIFMFSISVFNLGTESFLGIMGCIKSFSVTQYGVLSIILFSLLTTLAPCVDLFLSSAAAILSLWNYSLYDFYVVRKQCNGVKIEQ